MARDLRTNQHDYFDRNKWYKHRITSTGKFEKEEECQGVFYSKDLIAMASHKEQISNDTQVVKYTVTITTKDVVTGLEINDYVLYGGELWQVDDLPAVDDLNKTKQFNNRPQFDTNIALVRYGE